MSTKVTYTATVYARRQSQNCMACGRYIAAGELLAGTEDEWQFCRPCSVAGEAYVQALFAASADHHDILERIYRADPVRLDMAELEAEGSGFDRSFAAANWILPTDDDFKQLDLWGLAQVEPDGRFLGKN